MRPKVMLAAMLLAFVLPASAAAQSGDGAATVTVVHGLPETSVDLYVDGERTLPGTQPGSISDPMPLEGGSYRIAAREAGSDPSAEPLASRRIELNPGQNVSVAVHLDEEGDPRITNFVNDTSEVPAGKARVIVRHIAEAPTMDVVSGDEPLAEEFENLAEQAAEVDAGTIEPAVIQPGDDAPLIGPTELDVAPGGNYALYAIGSVNQGNTEFLVQAINRSAGPPGEIPAGNSVLEGESGAGTLLLALAAFAAAVAAASLAVLIRAARARRA